MLRKAGKWCLAVASVAAVLALRLGQEPGNPDRWRSGEGLRQPRSLVHEGQVDEAENQQLPSSRDAAGCGPVPGRDEKGSRADRPAESLLPRGAGQPARTITGEEGDSGDGPGATSPPEQVCNGRLERANRWEVRKHEGSTAAAAVLDVRSPLYVAEVLARHSGEIQECYRQRVKINPMLEGSMDVRFVVSPEGLVTSVTILESTLGDQELEKAIVNCMLSWSDFGRCTRGDGPHTYRQRYTFGVENR